MYMYMYMYMYIYLHIHVHIYIHIYPMYTYIYISYISASCLHSLLVFLSPRNVSAFPLAQATSTIENSEKAAQELQQSISEAMRWWNTKRDWKKHGEIMWSSSGRPWFSAAAISTRHFQLGIFGEDLEFLRDSYFKQH